MAPRRVVMFSNLFPPVASGSSTQCSELASQLVARGCEVAVITAKAIPESNAYDQIAGVHVYRLPAWRLPKMSIALNFPWLNSTLFRGNRRRVFEIVARHQPDVLHLHNHMFDLAFAAVAARRQFGCPLAVTIHTMIKHANPFYNTILYPLDRLLLRGLVLRHVDAILCPDRNIQTYVASAFGREGEILPYGISMMNSPDAELAEELRCRHDLHGKRVILSLGHVHEIRNRKTLVEALPMVRRAIPNVVLCVVGAIATDLPGKLAQTLGVADAVRLVGPAPHRDIATFLSLADLEAHWLNQDVPERTSLGIASLEAMSAGKVVMAAASEATYGPGILRDGENLAIVHPTDAPALANRIIGLLNDDRERRRIGENARRTVREHFSWDSVCKQTLHVYERLSPMTNGKVRRAA